ncbi:MAG: hypothetical protein GF372_03230 [Candidatus Marinimicrobia bacterium]|nr:hypothetical protein [Candidatus Neomarinimicrobiota bacterium]
MKKISVIIFTALLLSGVSFGQNLEVIEESFAIDETPFTVEIDMEAGQFEIRKSDEPGVLKMRVEYRPNRADVRHKIRSDRFSLDIHNENWRDGDNSRLKTYIYLPDDKIIDLDTRLKAGELDCDLGGLRLRNVEIRTYAGEADIRFSEPNRIAMQMLDIHCSVGETNLKNLGNARFERADINSGIGELSVDFGGSYNGNGKVRLDLDIGETRITLPDNLGVRVKVNKAGFLSSVNMGGNFDERDGYYYTNGYSSSEYNLNMMISTGIGELSIR